MNVCACQRQSRGYTHAFHYTRTHTRHEALQAFRPHGRHNQCGAMFGRGKQGGALFKTGLQGLQGGAQRGQQPFQLAGLRRAISKTMQG